MKRSRTLCVITMIGLSVAAAAQRSDADPDSVPGPYAGVSAGLLRVQENDIGTFSPTIVLARIGIPITRNLGFEARIGTGLTNDANSGYSVDGGLIGGGYLKGSLPLTPTLSVYGVAGVGTVRLVRNFGDHHDRNTGFSGGLGGDVNVTDRMLVNVEWTHYPTGHEFGRSYGADLFSAGVTWTF
jgi:opacity protein-like surface antigen